MADLTAYDNSLVTTGNPAEGGCCWTNFDASPALPTDATTAMASPWESLGDLSTNGYTESKSVTNNEFQGWRGSVVLTCISAESRTFRAEFIEVNRPSAAKLRYGAANVTAGTDGSVSKIVDKVGVNQKVPLVFDELESNGYLRRTVVKLASVTSFDDVAHQKGSLMVYGFTFTALDTGDGEPVAIYRAKPAAA